MPGFYVPQQVQATYLFEHLHAPLLREAVQKTIAEFLANSSKHILCKTLFDQLKILHPYIEKVALAYDKNQQLIITIAGSQPTHVVNNDFVITTNHAVVPIRLFTDVDLGTIPHIIIANSLINKTIDAKLHAFLNTIPEALFQSFSIDYQSPSTITLTPKESSNYRLLAHEETFKDQRKIDASQKIFHDSTMRKKAKKTQEWLLDLRFSNRIIVSLTSKKPRGDRYEETRTE